MTSFPMQPMMKRGDGKICFQQNNIVRRLLDESRSRGYGLNEMAGDPGFTQADWEQFYQLIGYTLEGYHELSHISDVTALQATAHARYTGFRDAQGCRDIGCQIHCGVERED